MADMVFNTDAVTSYGNAMLAHKGEFEAQFDKLKEQVGKLFENGDSPAGGLFGYKFYGDENCIENDKNYFCEVLSSFYDLLNIKITTDSFETEAENENMAMSFME